MPKPAGPLAGRAGALALAAALACLLLLAGSAWAEPESNPQDPAYLGFFPTPEPKGRLDVKVYPDKRATGKVTVFSFGMPFPPGYISDPKLIALLDGTGKEVPIHVKVLATWPAPVPHAGSIRAALIQFQDYLAVDSQRTYTVRWGQPRKEDDPEARPVRQDWLGVEDKSFPSPPVQDPPAYVVLPNTWLVKCLLKERMLPADADLKWEFYDFFARKQFLTTTNQFDYPVLDEYLVHPEKDAECWLFDRAATFWVTYFRYGGLAPLRQAQRSSQLYASLMHPEGRFQLLDPKQNQDMKYGFQECLAMDYWLSGDERMLTASQNVADLLETWNFHLRTHGFWTERHLAFALLNATVRYELTGDPKMLEKAREVFEAAYSAQLNPLPGAPKDGCMVHTGEQHGEGLDGWVCSSWMSALAVDAMMRYYIVTADPRVAKSVELLAQSFVRYGTYHFPPSSEKYPWLVPHYLYGSQPPKDKDDYEYDDAQHCIDTLKIMAVAQYFMRKEGRSNPEFDQVRDELLKTAKWNFDRWHNPGGPKVGKPEYSVLPKRRYGWTFRTTASLDWLFSQK